MHSFENCPTDYGFPPGQSAHVPAVPVDPQDVLRQINERAKTAGARIAPMDWKSGENLWLMDMICPFGGQDEAMKELNEKAFGGKPVKTLQPAPTGEGMAVVEF